MAVDLLLGLQWGDEGKGKIVDVLTKDYDIIARFQGGPNAGHTLEFDGIKHVLHTIPSGIFHDNAMNVIGNGVVIDPVIFKKELQNLDKFEGLDYKAKMVISRKAHLILPTHRLLDAASEASKGKAKIGSTLKGIGPTYMDKTGRNGIRVGDLELADWKDRYATLRDKHISMIDFYDAKIEYDLEELESEFFAAIKTLKTLQFIDSEEYLYQAQKGGKSILAEGAQGSLLDIDFGTYPFVTSSNTTAAGACTGLGVPPNQIGEVFGIFKAYTTRVGSGPFPTELFDEDGETMGRVGNEFGATTGRARRCGWLDLVALKYAVRVNGVTQLMMMKGDVLSGFKTLKVCTAYKYKGETIEHLPYNIEPENVEVVYKEMPGWSEDLTGMTKAEQLPKELNDYIDYLEKELETPIKIVSVGPDRTQTILR
ncbi:adenylosuccinate synthase [Dokdonia donghaensis]|uniref:Adenylosuccinate synthetase n=1 Tax=Dokdonia donghaensis DSW-1 TaxID=1300343 RepID=A0A0A2GQ77_9FLAO|nr:adenylosuccinate synthase [Dokdonia donghaensis]ANH61393.1 Adenylosuccinate synthetase [Dokdonia donghaensis DSW-1]KGO05424.1 adenylosuccinate synthetase [Dokdonia donghaensis DSW-1]